MKKPGKVSPQEAVRILEKRREAQRLRVAAGRIRNRAAGLVPVQVSVPDDAAELVRAVAAALRAGSWDQLDAACKAVLKYQPKPRHQRDIEDLLGDI